MTIKNNNKVDNSQQLLNWLNKEKEKDYAQIKKSKEDFIKEIKKFKKDDFFIEKKKTNSLWRKIRMLIWGY